MNVIDMATGNQDDCQALSRHHDLWVELSRTEMIMEALEHRGNEHRQRQLRQRCSELRQAMQHLPA